MIVTDGQLAWEAMACSPSASAGLGVGVLMGSGALPDLTAMHTALKSSNSSWAAGRRELGNGQAIGNYLKTTLARTLFVDVVFTDVGEHMIPNGYILYNFSKSAVAPLISVSGTPTWCMLFRPALGVSVSVTQFTSDTSLFWRHACVFSVGAPASGAEMILPGSGSVTAGQVFRLSDLAIPISNLLC